jgi:pimeloyl-ACP methyl ester carboxylesterase
MSEVGDWIALLKPRVMSLVVFSGLVGMLVAPGLGEMHPVLAVTASDDSMSQWWKGRFTLAEYHERQRAVPQLDNAVVNDAGHMLHHDQPQVLAHTIEHFLARADLT